MNTSLTASPSFVEVLAILTPPYVITGYARVIQQQLQEDGLCLHNGSRRRLTTQDATFLTRSHLGQPYFANLITHLTSGPVILMHVHGHDPITILHRLTRRTGSILESAPLRTRDARAPHALYYSQSSHDAIQDLIYVGFLPTQAHATTTPNTTHEITSHTPYARSA